MLRQSQLEMAEHLRTRNAAALFAGMGRGKTAATLAALGPEHLPALVVAPPRVAKLVWPAEAARWRPDLTCVALDGPPAKRAAQLAAGADIVVVSNAILASIPAQFRTVILDELSAFKSISSRRTKEAIRLGKGAAYRWGLTGTPTPGGYLDLFAQIGCLDRGQALGRSITHYRQRHFQATQYFGGYPTAWALKDGEDAAIRERIAHIVYALPGAADGLECVHNRMAIEMPPKAWGAYQAMKRHAVAELGDQDITAVHAGAISNKLKQVTSGHMIDAEQNPHPVHTAKLDALQEFQGERCLVFHWYRWERAEILRRYPQAVSIDTPGAVAAWNRKEIPMLVAHPASAGHGLNLQHGGHHIVWTTLPWSLELWEQANARLVRPGQTETVAVHTLEVCGTIDAINYERLTERGSVQAALLAHLEAK